MSETRVIAVMVGDVGKPIFDEGVTVVRIDDEGAGEFVRLEQDGKSIGINPEEWPAIRAAINKMIRNCRGGQVKKKRAEENNDLYWYAINYRTAATPDADACWKELVACVNRLIKKGDPWEDK